MKKREAEPLVKIYDVMRLTMAILLLIGAVVTTIYRAGAPDDSRLQEILMSIVVGLFVALLPFGILVFGILSWRKGNIDVALTGLALFSFWLTLWVIGR